MKQIIKYTGILFALLLIVGAFSAFSSSNEDGEAMKSSIVYSFTLDTLTNAEATTFTVPDNFTNPYDLLVQGWMDELTGSATVIFETQVSTADSGTQFWTTVKSDTLTADGTFLVNAATPSTVVLPRTLRRVRVVATQTGTATSSLDLQVSAKRFPN